MCLITSNYYISNKKILRKILDSRKKHIKDEYFSIFDFKMSLANYYISNKKFLFNILV